MMRLHLKAEGARIESRLTRSCALVLLPFTSRLFAGSTPRRISRGARLFGHPVETEEKHSSSDTRGRARARDSISGGSSKGDH